MASAAAAGDGLNDRQRAFVIAYCECLSVKEAAERAGYSPKTARQMGSQTIALPKVRDAINKRLTERKMGGAEVIARLEQQATASLADFITIEEIEITTGRGKAAKTVTQKRATVDLEKALRLGVLHLLRDFKVDGRSGAVTIRLYDAQRALALLGRHHGVLGGPFGERDDDDQDDDFDGGEDNMIGDTEIRVEAELGRI